MKKLFVIVSMFCSVVLMAASAPTLESANKLYEKGHYGEARTQYESLVKQGLESAALYYNLGNTYYKNGDIPSAILYYEKALRLDPGNADIQDNLRFVNSKKIDRIEEMPTLFYEEWFDTTAHLFSVDGWAKAAVMFSFLFMAGMILYLISKVITLKKLGFWTGAAMLLLSLTSVGFAQHAYKTNHVQRSAIVFAPTLTVMSTPTETGSKLFVIHEGTKVFLLDQVENWYRIKLQDGNNGWVQKETVKEI